MSGKRKRDHKITVTCRNCKREHQSVQNVTLISGEVSKLYLEKVPDNYYKRAVEYVYNDKQDNEISEFVKRCRLEDVNGHMRLLHISNDEKLFINDEYCDNYVDYIYFHKKGDGKIPCVASCNLDSYTSGLINDELTNRFVKKFILQPIAGYLKGNSIISYCNFEIHTRYTFADLEDEPREITLVSTSGKKYKIHRYVAIATSDVLRTGVLKFKHDKVFNLNCDDVVLKWFVVSMYSGVYIFDDQIDKSMAISLLDYLHIIDKNQICKQIVELFNKNIGENLVPID
jgi:hypothetical protein